MGDVFGLGGSSATSTTPSSSSATPVRPLGSSEFAADGALRMPSDQSPGALAAAAKKRRDILARSGRSSTRLAPEAGTKSYQSSFLGSVQ